MSRITNYRLLLSAALIAAGILYSPSLRYPFIWDDMPVVRDNSYLRSPDTCRLFFQPSYWQKKLPVSRFDYRPFQMIALSAISRLGGRNPILFRVTNLLLHLLASLLIWKLLSRLGAGHGPALFAAAFFAFHPIHVETVVNARNISELLAAVLLLTSFILFIRRTGAAYLFLSCLCFLSALLCKESALVFPALLTATVLILQKETAGGNGLSRTVPFWLIGAGGAVAKLLISAGGPLREPPAIPAFIVGSIRLIGTYLRLLVFPARLKVLYSFNKPLSWAEPEWFLPLLLAAGLFIILAARIRGRSLFSWALAGLLISLLPSLAKIGQIGRIVAEQRLYFPSVFFCIAGTILLDRAGAGDRRRRAAVSLAVIIICLSFAGLTGEYLLSWRSNFSLWTRVTSLSPRSAIGHNNLAIIFHHRGEDERARLELETALRINPGHKEAHSNLGVLHSLAGRWRAAIDEFKRSLKSDPSYYPASLHLAKVYLRQNRLDEAGEILRSVLDQNPYLPEACNGLAIVLEERGESREAEILYRKAARLNPEYVIPLRNLAALYHERKEFDRAIEVGREAIRKAPEHPNGYLILARVYITLGRIDEARKLLREGLLRDPDNWKIKSRLMALDSVRPE